MKMKEALAHLSKDPILEHVFSRIEMPDFAPPRPVYEALIESVISQQLSVKVADVIHARFLSLFPENNPAPNAVIALDISVLRSVGLSNQKANYIRNIAQFALENDLSAHKFENMSDESIIEYLTQIKGVGKWTVQMLLMFVLNRHDVLPVDDLGIQQGMARLYGLDSMPLKELKQKMNDIAAPWRPWRTVACRYIWRYKDTKS